MKTLIKRFGALLLCLAMFAGNLTYFPEKVSAMESVSIDLADTTEAKFYS